jgi:ferredoxin-like protein FixX
VKYIKTLREEIMQILHKLYQNVWKEYFSIYFIKPDYPSTKTRQKLCKHRKLSAICPMNTNTTIMGENNLSSMIYEKDNKI